MQIATRRQRRIYQFEYVVWRMHFQAFGEDWIPKFGVLDGVSLVYDLMHFIWRADFECSERQPSF
jgi:hypothetical protein